MIKKFKSFLEKIKTFLASHWKKFLLGAGVLVVVGFIARRTILKPPTEYETVTTQVKNLTQTLEVSGEINADSQADLRFQTIGQLAWLGVKEGDPVKKWQAVASLDKRILEKNIKNALSDYMHQRWDFDQVREDYQVTTDNYDDYSFTDAVERLIEQEQFLLDKTVTEVEIDDITKKLATLISPIDGIVTRLDKPVPGVNVAITDTIMQVVDPSTLYFEVEIDESDIGTVSLGQSAEILLEAFPDEPIDSEITWIDFAASTSDSGGTVFIAKLKLPFTEETKLRLGMTGDAIINVKQKYNVLSVSLDAIREEDDRVFVQVMQDGQLVEKEVELGLETEDDVEIISGLTEGDTVITGEKEK